MISVMSMSTFVLSIRYSTFVLTITFVTFRCSVSGLFIEVKINETNLKERWSQVSLYRPLTSSDYLSTKIGQLKTYENVFIPSLNSMSSSTS